MFSMHLYNVGSTYARDGMRCDATHYTTYRPDLYVERRSSERTHLPRFCPQTDFCHLQFPRGRLCHVGNAAKVRVR